MARGIASRALAGGDEFTLLGTEAGKADGLADELGGSVGSGALGLVLPAATRIRPRLTPVAALGLVTVMLLAVLFHVVFHVARGEFQMLPVNVVLGGLASFVAWGRFEKVPIAPR